MLGGSVAEPMCWVGGWLDQVGIRLTQLSTGLKVEAELGKKSYFMTSFLLKKKIMSIIPQICS